MLERILLTGLHGTLAPKLAAQLERSGARCSGWDRASVPPADEERSRQFLESASPDAICHLAIGDERWAALLARHAYERQVPFLFTSTAMVFDHEPDGPHRPDDPRNAKDGYGQLKIRTEDAIREANPDAVIARLGWQIDPDGRGNNMLAQLDSQQRSNGEIRASTLWRPACSFMEDTAAALCRLLDERTRGTFHLDSNARDALTFDAVVRGLGARFGRTEWRIHAEASYRHDQRLVGNEDLMPALSARLGIFG